MQKGVDKSSTPDFLFVRGLRNAVERTVGDAVERTVGDAGPYDFIRVKFSCLLLFQKKKEKSKLKLTNLNNRDRYVVTRA